MTPAGACGPGAAARADLPQSIEISGDFPRLLLGDPRRRHGRVRIDFPRRAYPADHVLRIVCQQATDKDPVGKATVQAGSDLALRTRHAGYRMAAGAAIRRHDW